MNLAEKTPSAAGTVHGGEHQLGRIDRPQSANHRRGAKELTVRLAPGGPPITVFGRQADTLDHLIRCGAVGFTSGEASPLGWARRTSAYIRKLRQAGVPIGTTYEQLGDARVGRYALVGAVELLARVP